MDVPDGHNQLYPGHATQESGNLRGNSEFEFQSILSAISAPSAPLTEAEYKLHTVRQATSSTISFQKGWPLLTPAAQAEAGEPSLESPRAA